MQKYLSENVVDIFFILGISSIAILVISALSIGYFIKKIPYDYFLNDKRGMSRYKDNNPILWIITLAVKNLVGYCLILGGILMLVLPGQGLLTILVGLMLSDYPGKFKLEKRIIKTSLVLKTVNWYRAKSGIQPIIFK
tara:strand:- start:896 stop:1309 length:414 start_codon:yes stop_codon:yes gene_type:complete